MGEASLGSQHSALGILRPTVCWEGGGGFKLNAGLLAQ